MQGLPLDHILIKTHSTEEDFHIHKNGTSVLSISPVEPSLFLHLSNSTKLL